MKPEVTPLIPRRLRPGDRVRFVSPASTPDRALVARGVEILEAWGLVVELGAHVFDTNGHYLGVKAVAVGQFIRSAEPKRGKWSIVDVLRDQLTPLGVPVLGGLPIGHGPHPPTVPLGTVATLDTVTRTLTIEPGVLL